MAQHEAIIRVLEEEKDYYKKEYETLKALKRSATPSRATPTKVRIPGSLSYKGFVFLKLFLIVMGKIIMYIKQHT